MYMYCTIGHFPNFIRLPDNQTVTIRTRSPEHNNSLESRSADVWWIFTADRRCAGHRDRGYDLYRQISSVKLIWLEIVIAFGRFTAIPIFLKIKYDWNTYLKGNEIYK